MLVVVLPGELALHALDGVDGGAQFLAELPQVIRRRPLVSLVPERLDVFVELPLRPRRAEGARRTAVEPHLILAGEVQLDALPRPTAGKLDGDHAMAHSSPRCPSDRGDVRGQSLSILFAARKGRRVHERPVGYRAAAI